MIIQMMLLPQTTYVDTEFQVLAVSDPNTLGNVNDEAGRYRGYDNILGPEMTWFCECCPVLANPYSLHDDLGPSCWSWPTQCWYHALSRTQLKVQHNGLTHTKHECTNTAQSRITANLPTKDDMFSEGADKNLIILRQLRWTLNDPREMFFSPSLLTLLSLTSFFHSYFLSLIRMREPE
jgi:hypothetical protein